jgi:hypothetical protein
MTVFELYLKRNHDSNYNVLGSSQVMTSPFLDPVLLNDTTEFPVDKSTLTSLPKSGADDETFNIAITSQYWKEFL